MMIVDKHRNQELTSMYGTVNPAYFARTISSRLVATTFLSVALFCVLIIAGALNLFWRQKQNSRQAFATILTVSALIGCGASALSELGFVDYLLHLH
jgi:preprotein translocase subunit SecG